MLDATSADALAKSGADKVTSDMSAVLVLQKANVSVVEEWLASFPSAVQGVLVTSTQSAISSLASSTAFVFQLPDHADQQVVTRLLRSIEDAFSPRQHVVTLVASGGTGKTQAVLKFISRNFSR